MIEEMIISGQFVPGGRIPPERELLGMFDVSYMTLRRAIKDLADRGIIIRRGQRGSFLSSNALRLLENKKVNFVYSTWEGPFFAELLQAAVAEIERCGYEASVVHFQENSTSKIQEFLEHGEAVIIYGINSRDYPDSFKMITDSANESGSALVIIGTDDHVPGVYGVRADDAAAMKLALQCLQEAGHRRIMLATLNEYLNLKSYNRISKWFDYARDEGYMDRRMEYLVSLGSSRLNNLDNFRDVLCTALKSRPDDVTALICMNHAILIAVLSAAWNLGIRIPEDLSLVVIGDTVLSDFSQPPISGVSVKLNRHMELAMQLIMDHELQRTSASSPLIVQPELIRRASVKVLNASN